MKPAVPKRSDSNQFGTIPNSSTTQALIRMLHTWNKHTDGNGSTVRVVMFDFKKAFDLIDHRILAEKLLQYEIPTGILHWIIDSLTNRKQRVKLAQDCHSEWGSVAAGVPQGTKLGPWLFLVMINDLDVEHLDLWKFVDDTTMAESVDKSEPSKIQASVDELASKSQVDRSQLNEAKCKELRISFAKTKRDFEPITINSKPIDVVPHAKLLGLNISCNLKWNVHISETVRKVSSRSLLPKTTKTGEDCYQGINYLLQNLYQASFRIRLSSVP